jgi:hypothetical protein
VKPLKKRDGERKGITNAYRAELAGILAAINFTNDVCTSMKITSGTCKLYCVNKGALSASFGHKWPHPQWSSYDQETTTSSSRNSN